MMKDRRYYGLSIKIALAAFIVIALVAIASMQLRYNELKAEYVELSDKVSEYREDIGRLQEMLDMPFDDAYIEMIAREKLGLCRPEEIIINSDLTD